MMEKTPYDTADEESILDYAGKLTGKTLGEALGEIYLDTKFDEGLRGDVHGKGFFGQILEKEYFFIENNIWFDDGSTMVTIWYARTVFDVLCRK